MMKYKLMKIISAGLLLVSTNVFATTILNFDNPPVSFQDGYGDSRSYVEGDYTLSTVSDPGRSGSFIRFNPDAQTFLSPNNGSVYVGVTIFANPWLQRTDGGTFSLISLDIAEYNGSFPNSVTSVSLTGVKVNGDLVQTSLTLDGLVDGAGGINDFQNYVLNWDNLVRVNFDSTLFAFDNVKVAAAVPAPATLSLFALGLAGMGFRRKNEKTV